MRLRYCALTDPYITNPLRQRRSLEDRVHFRAQVRWLGSHGSLAYPVKACGTRLALRIAGLRQVFIESDTWESSPSNTIGSVRLLHCRVSVRRLSYGVEMDHDDLC